MQHHRGVRATAAPLALISALAMLGGCSDDASDESSPASPQAPATGPTGQTDPTVSSAADATPALRLHTSDAGGSVCVASRIRDYAWFDVTWKATEDLESMAFDLPGAEHVRAVGDALTVPPVNYGGRIDYSGATSWTGRADLGKDRQISWSQRDTVWSWTPVKGQTGLLVLHLRFDGEPARIDRVRARWTTQDGRTGSTEVAVPERWRFGPGC